ncbi:flagellar hook basal-body protein [Geomonas sp. RF6]|uniref:flagellar hook-basal body protein n=1 Tax=Geomonas sp. RF6 TaxID=2897342 RepID=UPI001E455163|nr:flagellar hook basal-body protein [Geomonas sp. RF6]UFS72335.1 flagellar hook basal-body protein [Geomonas sp. RF6]
MSITSAMYTGVSGLLSNAQALTVIGNNISNVNTTGFKSGRTIFADMLSNMYMLDSQIGTGSQLQAVNDIFSQGSAQVTGNVTDLSIAGSSFFALKEPNTAAPVPTQDQALLTRAGAFSVDNNYTLVNPAGFQVLDTTGNPIKFLNTGVAPTTDFAKIVKVDPNGTITYLATDGVTQNFYNASGAVGIPTSGVPAARLAVVTASNPAVLRKVGGSLYKSVPSAGVPTGAFTLAANAPNATSERVISNSLEASNVDMANEFVNMILTQRAYSASSKTITTTDQMTQEVLGLIR